MKSSAGLPPARHGSQVVFRKLGVGGGLISPQAGGWRFFLPASAAPGYADAQIDDYGGKKRKQFPWRPATRLKLEARFSHQAEWLQGTAGFGFWNAPFGDPTMPWPARPQAAWFFFASPPTDLPLAASGPGRGWFAGTIDAGSRRALPLLPLFPPLLLLNQIKPVRLRLWPAVQERLGITFQPLAAGMSQWHTYEINWQPEQCHFLVDGRLVLQSPHSPAGPLGFVCWMDNQYLVATARGRWRWGTLARQQEQWLDVKGLQLGPMQP